MSNSIWIIIPVFNRWNFTKACLKSLVLQTYKNFQVIVVDHGSIDGTSEFIAKEFPDVIVLKGDASMWWTAATNLGVRYAISKNAEYIITLNNDLTVLPNYLEQLVGTAKKFLNSLIGSICLDNKSPERAVFAGTKWNAWTARYRPAISLTTSYSSIKENYSVIESDMLPGRGTLIPVAAFQKVGLFDQNHFPHYCADEDFSRRCLKEGYKLYINVNAPVYSEVEATGLKSVQIKRGTKYLMDNFFSIKSPNKLSIRWYWAKKHSPVPFIYFLFDITRILYSFSKKAFKEIVYFQ